VRRSIRYLMVATAALLASNLGAGGFSIEDCHWYGYGPYADSEPHAAPQLNAISSGEGYTCGQETRYEYKLESGTAALINIDQQGSREKPEAAVTLVTLPPLNRQPAQSVELVNAGWCQEVLYGDLNHDGKNDFVLLFEGAERTGKDKDTMLEEPDYEAGRSTLLLLSGPAKHAACLVRGVEFQECCFLNLTPGAETQVLAARRATDPRKKNMDEYASGCDFWIYDLYALRGQALVAADSLDARFPKIVARSLSSQRKNTKETALLDAGQKKALLRKYPVVIGEIPVKVARPAAKLAPAKAGRKGK
jgi:hypothetical protein